MDPTSLARAGTALAVWTLVMVGHLGLPDAGRFGLFLACVAGAVLAAGGRAATRSPGPDPVGPAARDAGSEADHDALRRLEAELHALEDQLRSAPDRDALHIGGPWTAAESARG